LEQRFIEVLKEYLSEVTEDSIKENFITVYQLLDEVVI